MPHTHVILDGLQDPESARRLSTLWAEAGFHNAIDPAAQTARLAIDDPSDPHNHKPLSEDDAQRAAATARQFGLEIRDRAGQTYRPENDPAALNDQMVYEYKSRFATALTFGLPALALHYLGPILAGAAPDPRSMVFPWLFELLLVGWAILAAAWPILWQGALSFIHLRATADLFTTLLILFAFIPSSLGVLLMIVIEQPWFVSTTSDAGPAFHAATLITTLAVLQRWLSHRAAPRITGYADAMLRGHSKLIQAWLVITLFVYFFLGWHAAIAFAMLLPANISLGAINPWSPGWSTALPVFGFALFMLIGPASLDLSLDNCRIETAAGFALLMTTTFALGWSRIAQRKTPATPNATGVN